VIATTDPDLFKGPEVEAWRTLRAAVRLARFGCDAYAYAMVAMGQMDLVIETGLKSWDIEGARAVLAGASGRVCDWRGAPIGGNGGQMLIAGDPRCLEAAAGLLSAAARA
jgi:fructose-1,6-bisphosphatase/inositol monophosphatase family enzyme